MTGEQIAILALGFTNCIFIFITMYQDWKLEQYRGYIERMDREHWSNT